MSLDHESPPASTGRLFPDLGEADLARLEPTAHIIARLLEDGSSADLHWLSRTTGEDALRRWFEERGERQLSRRSRAFWSLLLTGAPTRQADNPLWPL